METGMGSQLLANVVPLKCDAQSTQMGHGFQCTGNACVTSAGLTRLIGIDQALRGITLAAVKKWDLRSFMKRYILESAISLSSEHATGGSGSWQTVHSRSGERIGWSMHGSGVLHTK